MSSNGHDLDVGGLQLDPAVLAELARDGMVNQAALTDKQRKASTRVSLRIDCPDWLKNEVAKDASGEDLSVSHWARFLMAWALTRYRDRDPDLLAAVEQARYPMRSLNSQFGLDEGLFREDLDPTTDSADED